MSYEPAKAQTFALELPTGKYSPFADRAEVLLKHREWLDSHGETGERADFSGAHLDGVDLTDANLEDAWLNKTTLKNADLLLANFQRASLIQANLQGANLLGTRFQEADLQGATLENTTGLQVEQLAGANLFGATLPADVDVFDALADAARAAKLAGRLILALLVLTALIALRVITTADWQILSNAPILPFRIFRPLPLGAVYLLAPALLLGLYVWLHLFLQSLWESVSRLPAVFPDGRTLDKGLPFAAALVARTHLKWLRNQNRALVALENALCQILLYWIVPATIVLFWGRYLTSQDFRGTLLHILQVVAASIAAVYFCRAMTRTLGCASPAVLWNDSTQERKRPDLARVFPLVLGAAILILSIGVISGAPRDDGTTPRHSNFRIQSWAADLLWLVGYSPVAQVPGASISVKPANWSGRDEDLGAVLGARLGKARLRYIQANGAFLAKSDLWQADLQGADLSEADLREIKAREARLRYVSLDRAKLDRATLEGADLQQANLTRADLKGADLTYSSLTGAALVDADLEGASLYSADMRGALLQRAKLQQADLREANLAGDDLTAANLGSAYLSSAKMAGAKLENADLDAAFLTEADLRGADLRNAKLTGAALNGANLHGADLRGASGLSATQVCSAAEIGQIQLDDALRQDVEAECHSTTR
jgi:uncharacterized protein YjbI with pentapeptide repeats